MIRVLIAGLVACAVTGCAARHPLTMPPTPTCFRMKVAVTADDGSNRLVAPGTPIDIVVRSQQGRVLYAVATDSSGNASFAVCWRPTIRHRRLKPNYISDSSSLERLRAS